MDATLINLESRVAAVSGSRIQHQQIEIYKEDPMRSAALLIFKPCTCHV